MGFGSKYFSDFTLIHKTLGITDMISIERNVQNRVRFEFNRPYDCIDLMFGESNEILPTLHWRDIRTILWLDYDDKLDSSKLTDIGVFFANAAPSSVILVTVNAESDSPSEDPLQELSERVGENRVPRGLTKRDLVGWSMADTSRRIIANEIDEVLSARNGPLPDRSKLNYEQLFNFRYKDGARMLTVGGLLHDKGQATMVSGAFDSLPFIRHGDNDYHIEIPNLTYREMRHLDSQLPDCDYRRLDKQGISASDFEKYSKTYRYFPNYAETEM